MSLNIGVNYTLAVSNCSRIIYLPRRCAQPVRTCYTVGRILLQVRFWLARYPKVNKSVYMLFRGGRRKFSLGGGHSSNIVRAKNFGHAPLIERQGSRVLLVVQNDEKWTANMHRDRFLGIY